MKDKMRLVRERLAGIGFCLAIALFSQWLGSLFPIVGGAVFAMLIGFSLSASWQSIPSLQVGVHYTSKKLLQYAVVLLGFGLDIGLVLETGKQSLPILLSTISIALLVSFFLGRRLGISEVTATLIGVGSAICGGSAIAATAPVIDAKEEEVAQAISVIVLFNVVAALLFPMLGSVLGFPTDTGEVFGIFAGTAVNDTSSVTATASTWDSLYQLGSQTLDKAVTVKLTRTLAIIPITLLLAWQTAKKKSQTGEAIAIKPSFPSFILFFIGASIITSLAHFFGAKPSIFEHFKQLSKLFIIMAMAGIGLQTNLRQLRQKGGCPILLGFICWLAIIIVTLILLYYLYQ